MTTAMRLEIFCINLDLFYSYSHLLQIPHNARPKNYGSDNRCEGVAKQNG